MTPSRPSKNKWSITKFCSVTNGPRHENNCLWGFTNKTGADHPAHPRSLVSAFVIRFYESTIYRLATDEISIFWLVSVAEEYVLKLPLSETPKKGFLATRPKLNPHKSHLPFTDEDDCAGMQCAAGLQCVDGINAYRCVN